MVEGMVFIQVTVGAGGLANPPVTGSLSESLDGVNIPTQASAPCAEIVKTVWEWNSVTPGV